MATVSKVYVGIQKGTDRTFYATWSWGKAHTKEFRVIWQYSPGEGKWYYANSSGGADTVNVHQSVYSAPSNAVWARVAIKPVATTHKVNKKDVEYWTATYSKYVQRRIAYEVKNYTPEKPSTPTVNINNFTLTAEVSNYDSLADYIQFQVVKQDKTTVKTVQAKKVTARAAMSYKVAAGNVYKVRCRAYNSSHKKYSGWSEYSADVGTIPATPKKIKSHKVLSESSVQLNWDKPTGATKYNIEYTTDSRYFGSSSEVQTMSVTGVTHCEITGLETGRKWFFRLQAENDKGTSGWTPVYSIILGKTPAAPTTWSEVLTATKGEKVRLFWVHNSEDGSDMTGAQVELTIAGKTTTQAITKSATEDQINTYTFDTSPYADGAVLKWRVRTKGILAAYGAWSTQRQITIYVPPVLEIAIDIPKSSRIDEGLESYTKASGTPTLTNYPAGSYFYTWDVCMPTIFCDDDLVVGTRDFDNHEDAICWVKDTSTYYQFRKNETTETFSWVKMTADEIEEVAPNYNALIVFPFKINLTATPTSQTPVGYTLEVVSTQKYQTVNQLGETVWVNKDETMFSKYISSSSNTLTYTMTADEIDLENNITYRVKASVAMSTGLTASDTETFRVEWDEDTVEPNAEIGIDEDHLSAYIIPYIVDEDDELVSGYTLAVYRREYDGRFVELATDIENTRDVTINDPHPALDYARYRIIAQQKETGAISFYDPPGYPVGESSIVLQWDEEWTDFESEQVDDDGEAYAVEDEMVDAAWSGSMLKLPYNVDIADSYGMDVEFVEYIGRQHPVSYYGTQLGVTSTWNTDIIATDVETLYALRRLAIYTGDVYVREPSGSGYWAQVVVSFSKKHREMIIPVTLQITRVSGGI